MRRRTRSRFPGMAKLASGVVIGGVVLGLLVSLTVDTEMKRPVTSPERLPGLADATSVPQGEAWPDGLDNRNAVADGFRPDLDYDAVVGAEWAVESGVEPPPTPIDDAVEAARAADAAAAEAREAGATTVPEASSEPRRSRLTQGGLY